MIGGRSWVQQTTWMLQIHPLSSNCTKHKWSIWTTKTLCQNSTNSCFCRTSGKWCWKATASFSPWAWWAMSDKSSENCRVKNMRTLPWSLQNYCTNSTIKNLTLISEYSTMDQQHIWTIKSRILHMKDKRTIVKRIWQLKDTTIPQWNCCDKQFDDLTP